MCMSGSRRARVSRLLQRVLVGLFKEMYNYLLYQKLTIYGYILGCPESSFRSISK